MNDFLLQNAWRLHQAGNFTEAARLYQDVLRSNPKHFGALQMLGFLHFQTGEYENAEKVMGRALKIEPKSVDALYNRGCALQALDRHKDALSCFDKAIDINRDYAQAHFNRGNSLFRLGRHKEALASYDRALAIQPAYAEALLNRANALLELKRPEEALANYDHAIKIDPRQAILWNNRGNALAELARHTEALSSYEKAIALEPRYSDAFENRGDTLGQLGRCAEALVSYERALALDPANTSAQHKRARMLAQLNRHEDALAAFGAVLAMDSDDVSALIGKGVALASLRRYDDSLAALDAALAREPANADALSNRANVLLAMKRPAEALAASEKALSRDPAHLAALHNRASALSNLRRYTDAVAAFDRALAQSQSAASWNGRGTAMLGLKHYAEALRNFDTAIALDPGNADAFASRAEALVKLRRYPEATEASERALALHPGHAPAIRERAHARMNACDWRARDEEMAMIAAALARGDSAIQPFDCLAMSDSEAQNRLAAELHAAQECPPQSPIWRGENYGHEKLRIGYLSTDFRAHAVAFLIVGALEHHDKSRFETIGFSIGPNDGSEVRERIVSALDRFVDLNGMNNAQAAMAMREMEIDIAVDLNGYTGQCRTQILAQRPAPIQVNYLGYPGTMGAPYIDYILADAIVIPEEARVHYSENIVYLPDTYQANDSNRRVAPTEITRASVGLPEAGFIFCSLSSSYKFAPAIFDIWMRLLNAVDGSVLWLLQDNASATAALKREAEARGVAGDRLIFAPQAPPAEHLARQRLADLFLDTLPYNAHTTASDALWMGLPIVTCTGATFPARVATSILHAAGLPELATSSLAEYEALALKLAREPQALAAVKAKIAARKGDCRLFDTAGFTRHLESAYLEMWRRHRDGLPAQGFAIAAGPK